MSKNLYTVILAGGIGTRFWPLSRKARPKQFLNITGEGTLLQQTLARSKRLVSSQNTFIVTGRIYDQEVKKQIKAFKIPWRNVLLEPSGKNTAPSIFWAAKTIHELNPKATMLVLPADHHIANSKEFYQVLKKAFSLAQSDALVTLGITPDRPETGYGYLKTKRNGKFVVVEKFTEKPSLNRARQFLKAKTYLWNSGMFIWRTEVILSAFQKYLPGLNRLLKGQFSQQKMLSVWSKLPSLSIDYGILEKANNVVTVPAKNLGWSDLGSWQSLMDLWPKDKNGNILKGRIKSQKCSNNLIFSQKRLLMTIGLQDLIIVDTDDALLICHKDNSQNIKEMVSILPKSIN